MSILKRKAVEKIMSLKFKNNEAVVVNFGYPLKDFEKEKIRKVYRLDHVEEINFKCKGFKNSTKKVYIQCHDWINLIPEDVITSDSFVIKFPDNFPANVWIYMLAEIYSRSNKFPKMIEYEGGRLNRIIDLSYECNFSRNKRAERNEVDLFNSAKYHMKSRVEEQYGVKNGMDFSGN